MKTIMIGIILGLAICLSGCNNSSSKCSCNNVDCGIQCQDRCEGEQCLPGRKCCNKCTCPKSVIRTLMDTLGG